MKKYILSIILSLSILSCSNSDDSPSSKVVSLDFKAKHYDKKQEIIYTKSRDEIVEIIGEKGTKVYINDNYYKEFDDSGVMKIELTIKHLGSTNYIIKAINSKGDSKEYQIELIRLAPDSKLGSIKTKGDATSLALSQNGTMFVAEKDSGLEIITIGFNDKISSQKIADISDINAKNVLISDDEKSLYILEDDDKYHIYDLSDIHNPKEIAIVDEIEKEMSSIAPNLSKKIDVVECGLVGYSGEDFKSRDFLIKDKSIIDALFVSDDEFLTAQGRDGLWLYSLKDPKHPKMIAKKSLNGFSSGLSLIKKDGILFVANGEQGVEIFNLDILLHEMKK